MCKREPRLVLVSLLIGCKSGARTLNQSLSEVIINQSNSLITFDTQFFAPDVTAAMLVERTIAKTSFGNLSLLLCKT